ncbi:type IV secretion protein Rhs [Opitutaceae bacterium TAV5]|nr:type IV secretion protein Rhs [Opitutaceae bacterium TAV5]
MKTPSLVKRLSRIASLRRFNFVMLSSSLGLFAAALFCPSALAQCGMGSWEKISYRSITGSGSLVGISGYKPTGNSQFDNDPTAPWNKGPTWKWKNRLFDGKYVTNVFVGGPPPGSNACNNCDYIIHDTYSGYWTYDDSSFGKDHFETLECSGEPWNESDISIRGLFSYPSECAFYDFDTIKTRKTLTQQVNEGCPCDPWYIDSTVGKAIAILSDPDSISAAIARAGGPIEGVLHRAFTQNMGLTTPETTTPIPFIGRGVTVTLEGCGEGPYQVIGSLNVGEFLSATDETEASILGPWATEHHVVLSDAVSFKDGKLSFEVPARRNKVTEIVESSIRLIPDQGRPIGSTTLCTNSVEFLMNLGFRSGGRSAGVLMIKNDTIDEATFTPSRLFLASFSESEVNAVREEDADGNKILRQIRVPEGLVDVVVTSPTSYDIRVYLTFQIGNADTDTGLYSPTGTPVVTYTFAEAAGSTPTNRKLSLTETRDGNAITTTYSQNTDGNWETVYGNGLKIERLTKTVSGADTTETRDLLDADETLVSRTVTVTRAFNFGTGTGSDIVTVNKTISETSGTGVDAVTTTYTYYDNPATDGMALGELKTRQTSTGNWESWTYDAQGRKAKRVSQFLGSAFNSADALNRVTTWDYATVDDLDGDDKPEALRTETDYLLGQETARRHHLTLTATNDIEDSYELGWTEERDIVCTVPGAAWDAPTNLVTTTRTGIFGERQHKTLWQKNPDGTGLILALEKLDDGGRTWTTWEGAMLPNGTIDPTTARRTEVIEDALGRETERNVYENNLLIDSTVVLERDALGRATHTAFLDGTSEQRDYACCGLNQIVSRDGITTTYERDALGRVVRETTAGIGTAYTYDAAGRTLTTSRVGSDSSTTLLATQTYNAAGRLLTSTDALGRVTAYTETLLSGGLTERKTVHPDTNEEISTFFPDGSPASVRGDAAAQWRDYAYGVETDGEYEQEYFPTGDEPSGTPAAQWVKRYRDHAGRNHLVRYPDSAEETSGYNAKGQLVRQTDADGVQTLFAYNDRGEQTVTALDINRNGVIDYAGDDRITRTATTYATRGSATVRRTITEVWEEPGDNPVIFSVTETAMDSLQSWSTARGLITHTSVTQDGAGNRTETTTAPDGSTSLLTYVQGRLIGETRKDADNVTLSEIAWAYDPHGRLASQTVTGIGATTYSYLDDGRVASVTTPDPGDGAQTTSYTYNNRGWPSKVTHPDAAETETTYYPTGQIKRTWGARTYPQEYTYDAQGRLKTLTTWKDFSGTTGEAVTTWNYDPQRGWLTQKLYADNQGPAWTYTPAGRLATRTWARGVVTTYGYTDAGDLASVTYSDSTPAVAHTYDRAGRLHTTTDAAGLLTRSYANGQLTGEVYSGTGLLSGKSVTRTFDSLQRQDSLSATSIQPVSYTYDAASRLATVTQGNLSASYSYHPNLGTVSGVIVSNGSTERARQERTFDVLGRVTRVDTLGNGSTLHARRDYTYNAANQRTQVTHEDSRRWAYGYDMLGQVTSAQKRLSDNTALPGYDFGYSFDDIGNRMSTTTNGRTAAYLSDALNRYTQRDYPGAIDVRGSASTAVTVLVNDGLTTRTGEDFFRATPFDNAASAVNAEIKIQAVDPGPPERIATETRALSNPIETDPYVMPSTPEGFLYDADGNLTQDGRWNYAWDGENRLVSAEMRENVVTETGLVCFRQENTHDSQGRRIAVIEKLQSPTLGWITANSRRLLYDGWNLLAEYQTSSSVLLSTHIWGSDLSGSTQGAGGVGGLLWTTTTTGTYAPGYDANGNIIAWIDTADGTLAGQRGYGAFGESVITTGINEELSFGFSTKYQDRLTGFYYYGYRYYSPNLGRWLSRDPIEEEGGGNLYGMMGNDLISHLDYLGLQMFGEPGTMYNPIPELPDKFKNPPPPDCSSGFCVVGTTIEDWFGKMLQVLGVDHVDIAYNGSVVYVGRGGRAGRIGTEYIKTTRVYQLSKRDNGYLKYGNGDGCMPCKKATNSDILSCLSKRKPVSGRNCQGDVQDAVGDCCLTGFMTLVGSLFPNTSGARNTE